MDSDLDLDWGNIPDYEQENRDFFNNELSREVRLNPNEQDMVVRKGWAEYAKEINSMRAQLRYMKKSIMYRGDGWGCNVEENTESKDLDLIEISENDSLYEVSSEKPKRFLIQKGGADGTLGVLDWDPKDCTENVTFGVAADSLVSKIIDKVLEAQAKGKKAKDAKAKPITLFKWKDYEWRLACINLLDDSKVTPELVKWSTYNGKPSCYTIGYYVQGGNSADYEFSFKTCGSRYFQHVHYSEKLVLDEITYLVTEILNAAVNRYYHDYDKYLIFEQK